MGDYTFTLQGAIDHAQADGNDLELKALNLSSAITAHEGWTQLPWCAISSFRWKTMSPWLKKDITREQIYNAVGLF